MSTSSIRLPSLYRNEMTVSTQCCVLSRSVKTKRDTYDLVLCLCHLQSQFHGPDTFLGNSSRRWIAVFSLYGTFNYLVGFKAPHKLSELNCSVIVPDQLSGSCTVSDSCINSNISQILSGGCVLSKAVHVCWIAQRYREVFFRDLIDMPPSHQ